MLHSRQRVGQVWGCGVPEQRWGQRSLFLLAGDQRPAQGHARGLILGTRRSSLQETFGSGNALPAERSGWGRNRSQRPSQVSAPAGGAQLRLAGSGSFLSSTNNVLPFRHHPLPGLCGTRPAPQAQRLNPSRNLLRSFCKPFLSSSLEKPIAEASRWVHADPAALLRSVFGASEQAKALVGAEGRL